MKKTENQIEWMEDKMAMRVTGRFFALASVTIVAVLCAGCWTQDDTYSISKDGNIRFTTLTTIKYRRHTFAELDEESNRQTDR